MSWVLFLSLPVLSAAYTWSFERPPQQCGDVSIAVTGGGTPPYRVLIIPYGPTPLENGIEVRKLLDIPFPNGQTKVDFKLNFPAHSQLVAVVSDSTAFGSGGTSVVAQVGNSSDASCFNPSTMVSPEFFFSIQPPNQIVQCQDMRIWWDPATAQGTPNFLGVIPGGQSFAIPQGQITQVPSQGTGFSWKPSLRAGTTLLLVGGDARGNGTAGSTLNLVSAGIYNDISCLNATSPSSTAGNPAGGSYQTGPVTTSPPSSSSSNTGAIVGGIVGGIAVIIIGLIVFWFFRKQKKEQRRIKERPVDLLNADDDEGEGQQPAQLPQYYQPEPFLVPDPTLRSSYDTSTIDDLESRRPLSGVTSSFYTRATTPDGLNGSQFGYGGGQVSSSSAGGRKAAPRPMRPVNIIQHDDAGAVEDDKEVEGETVELPPAYTALGKSRNDPSAPTAGPSTS